MRLIVEPNRSPQELAMRFCSRFKLRRVTFDELIHLRTFLSRLKIEPDAILLSLSKHKTFHALVEPYLGTFIHPDTAHKMVQAHFRDLLKQAVKENNRLLKDPSFLSELSQELGLRRRR